jgi:Tfp pilus assembly protein PilE
MLSLTRRSKAFTLIEIMVVGFIFIMVSGTLYKIFSGTWANYYKSQTKLTNLRAASLLLEYLKHDIRRATIPTSTNKYKLSEPDQDLDFEFQVSDGETAEMVHYTYNSSQGTVERAVGGKPTRSIASAKVAAFKVEVEGPEGNQLLKVTIKVDADKDEGKNRSANSAGNQVELKAILFPRFFKNYADPEEKYWNQARSVQ